MKRILHIPRTDKRAGLTVERDGDGRLKVTFDFDQPEAKGVISLQEDNWGLTISQQIDESPEEAIVAIDLYYQSELGRGDSAPWPSHPLLVVNNRTNDDAAVYIRILPGKVAFAAAASGSLIVTNDGTADLTFESSEGQ